MKQKRTFKEWLRKMKRGYLNRLRNVSDNVTQYFKFELGVGVGVIITNVIKNGWTDKSLLFCLTFSGAWLLVAVILVFILYPLIFGKGNH